MAAAVAEPLAARSEMVVGKRLSNLDEPQHAHAPDVKFRFSYLKMFYSLTHKRVRTVLRRFGGPDATTPVF